MFVIIGATKLARFLPYKNFPAVLGDLSWQQPVLSSVSPHTYTSDTIVLSGERLLATTHGPLLSFTMLSAAATE